MKHTMDGQTDGRTDGRMHGCMAAWLEMVATDCSELVLRRWGRGVIQPFLETLLWGLH